ncbi:MAG: hypothetical protein ABI358_13570 [Ginsengibacter sp.]
MKVGNIIKLAILVFYTVACANKTSREGDIDGNEIDTALGSHMSVVDTFETGKIIAKIMCIADPSESYALYIPLKNANKPLPVIYFFDPHGDGSFPLIKYKALAEKYNFILIGSNNSKNGNDWPTTENVWNTLANDSQKRLKISTNRIYTCGFSGGAKVATYVALNHHEVKGVIANGAALPGITMAGNFNFSFTAIAGEGDMNMTDLVAITNDLDKTQVRHRIIFFDGIHEWAPESTMDIAFAGLQLDAMRERLANKDDNFIASIISSGKKKIEDHLSNDDYAKAAEMCTFYISCLDGLSDEVNWFKEKDVAIQSNPGWQRQSMAKREVLAKEEKIKSFYEKQFQEGDINYWVKTIDDDRTKAKVASAEGAMYQRLLAYSSLAFYSISNQLITGNQNKKAQYFINLYKIADPKNSEAWYLSAIINARNNEGKAAQADLLKAVTLGFTDKPRLLNQPEFQNQGTIIDLKEIELKMKQPQ